MRTAILLAGLALVATSCTGTRTLVDPVLTIETQQGSELGVSTNYGVVFLGRTARAGHVDVTAYFGDGPSVESSVIEAIADDICTAAVDPRLPWVPLTFQRPLPGDRVLVMGRHGRRRWQDWATVTSVPGVSGILLRPDRDLPLSPDQVGAGVYVVGKDQRVDWWCVGLVSGYVDIDRGDGASTFLTVLGPEGLQGLVTYYRSDPLARRPPAREDLQ